MREKARQFQNKRNFFRQSSLSYIVLTLVLQRASATVYSVVLCHCTKHGGRKTFEEAIEAQFFTKIILKPRSYSPNIRAEAVFSKHQPNFLVPNFPRILTLSKNLLFCDLFTIFVSFCVETSGNSEVKLKEGWPWMSLEWRPWQW